MTLRRIFLGFLAAVHLLAGVSPTALAAGVGDELPATNAEHCAPEMSAHADMQHAVDVGTTDPMESCGHECRQCAACAMLPPAFVATIVSSRVVDYLNIRADLRLALRPDELLRPPI